LAFGIGLPHLVAEAFAIDKKNGNNHWRTAIEKEMSKVKGMVAFEHYENATPQQLQEGSQKLPGGIPENRVPHDI
jgi:ABC-type Fe3+/spermidine/putrescine transport system ATPase subunit